MTIPITNLSPLPYSIDIRLTGWQEKGGHPYKVGKSQKPNEHKFSEVAWLTSERKRKECNHQVRIVITNKRVKCMDCNKIMRKANDGIVLRQSN